MNEHYTFWDLLVAFVAIFFSTGFIWWVILRSDRTFGIAFRRTVAKFVWSIVGSLVIMAAIALTTVIVAGFGYDVRVAVSVTWLPKFVAIFFPIFVMMLGMIITAWGTASRRRASNLAQMTVEQLRDQIAMCERVERAARNRKARAWKLAKEKAIRELERRGEEHED